MSAKLIKRDRTARLVGIAHLLHQHPKGLTAQEIAARVGMNVRTVYRDLRALEEEVGVAVWQNGRRFGAELTSFLPPLTLTIPEAVTLFVSSRLMARYQDYRDPHIVFAFNKLAAILPSPVGQQIHASLATLADLPPDESRVRIFNVATSAWADRRKVRIWYESTGAAENVRERRVSPYFLEPNPGGHTRYVIGHDSYSGQVRTFKIERIKRADVTNEQFTVPRDFDIGERLKHAWGISDENLVQVVLRFSDRSAADRVRQSHWHASQNAHVNEDGTVDLTFDVGGLLEITPWILSWGPSVQVVAPAELRLRVADAARAQARLYSNTMSS